MRLFLPELYKRNNILFWMGWIHFVMFFFCMGLLSFNHTIISGESAWAKPTRYYLSSGISIWTFGWFIYHINSKTKIKVLSWLIAITLFFETAIIFIQSYRGVPSHFNTSDPFNAMMNLVLLSLMLIFIITIIYITFIFFNQKKMPISQHYTWGLRMGLVNFVVFSVTGLIMFAKMTHCIGGIENGGGMALFNWSHKHGDLRIAHFMGVHALQIIPLLSYYLFTKKIQVINFSILYFIATLSFLILALLGIPFLG
jgi:hypothetical protein